MPTLALSMIVRDAAKDLPACLKSARGMVDEIVVADTGSEDNTIEMARQHGARVIEIPWEGDFAKARNLALAEVKSDWVLMLDADERLDPQAGEKLTALLNYPGIEGYQITIRNYLFDRNVRLHDNIARENDFRLEEARRYPYYVEHENVRLFRRHPEIYFVGNVHETVGPRIEERGGKMGRPPASAHFLIHHFGLAEAKTRQRKNQFYFEMGLKKVQEDPNDHQAQFELGMAYLDHLHDAEKALPHFERAGEIKPKLSITWFFAGVCQNLLGRHAEALERLNRADSLGRKTAALAEMQGDSCYNLGDMASGRACYRRAHKRGNDSPELNSKLGLAEVRCGDSKQGLRRLRRAIEREPASPESHDRLITACIFLNRLEEAAQAAENKLTSVPPEPKFFMTAASIRAQIPDWPKVAEILQQGVQQFPQAASLRTALTEVQPQIIQ